MAESRSQRMQVVLMLAERKEQEAAQRLAQFQRQIHAEEEQLKQLDEYANQYLQTYSSRTNNVRADELIAYSGFIQRLGAARKDQELRLEMLNKTLEKLRQTWRENHHKCESIKDLILRLEQEQNHLLEKKLQKELDELVGQQYARGKLSSDSF